MISSSTLSHGHRRQISTPALFEAAKPPVLAAMPPRRTHRRGQTVDYGSVSSQIPAVDRRNAPNKVAQLRDFFNEKAGYSRPTSAAYQLQSSQQQDGPSFMPSGIPTAQAAQYQPSYTWSPEELQTICGTPGGPASSAVPTAPPLSRSASDNADANASLKNAMYRMRQVREQRDLQQWESLSQPQTMIPKEQATGYAHSTEQLSVQPERIAFQINPYLSCQLNIHPLYGLNGLLTASRRHFSPYPRIYPIEEFF